MKNDEGTAGKAAAVEFYRTGRYFALTNEHLPGTPRTLSKADDALQRLVDRLDQAAREKGAVVGPDGEDEAAASARGNPDDPLAYINGEALKRLDDWMPELLPEARRQAGTGGYRVSSEALGRDLEEDLSITPQGIVDWGLHDMPREERRGRRTAIDLVREHHGAPDMTTAARWLAGRLGLEAEFEAKLEAEKAKVDNEFAKFLSGVGAEASADEARPEQQPRKITQTAIAEKLAQLKQKVGRTAFARRTSFTMAELMDTEVGELRWCVPELLPEGLVIFGGKRKAAKTWLLLDLGHAVATGREFLGRRIEAPGDVLLILLEDSDRRVKDRYTKLGLSKTDRLRIHTTWPTGDAAIMAILDWALDVSNPRLVVIDTLQRFRGTPAKRREGDAYQIDVAELAPIQKLAIEGGLPIVCVTHLRKSTGNSGKGDWMEQIIGSGGIVGTADTIIGLDRDPGSNLATLHVTGRDVDTFDQTLVFENFRWRASGLDDELDAMVGDDTLLAAIALELRDAGGTLTRSDLLQRVGRARRVDSRSFLRALTRGVERGVLEFDKGTPGRGNKADDLKVWLKGYGPEGEDDISDLF
jgi:hypothetical protein